MVKAVFFRYPNFGSQRVFWKGWVCLPDDLEGRTDALHLRNLTSGKMFCPIHRRWEFCRPGKERFSFICPGDGEFSGLPVPYAPPLASDDDPVKTDGEGIAYTASRYVIETDCAKGECRLSVDSLDFANLNRETYHYPLPSRRTDVYRYVFGSGLVAAPEPNGRGERDRAEPRHPAIVSQYAELAAQMLANVFAGKEIRVNKGYYRGIPLLEALAHCPYEANMHAVLAVETQTGTAWLDPAGSDVYNEWCRHYHFKSFPALRKEFETRPGVLREFQRLRDWGFRDVNVMMDAIKRYPLGGLSDHCKLFVEQSLKKRPERATMRAIFKDPRLDAYKRNDLARMFSSYYEELAPQDREGVLRHGFTKYNHDLLAKVISRLHNPNRTFVYAKEELALEEEGGRGLAAGEGYEFRLPKDSYTLSDVGAALHNCVASYRDRVLRKNCLIVYALWRGRYALCIEVVDGRVVQAVADHDSRPTGLARSALQGWAKRHHLIYEP